MGKLDGKVAIVTGGGEGIGRAGASLFAREGAKVAILERTRNTGEITAAAIKDAGGTCVFIETDMTEPSAVQNAFDRVMDLWGSLGVIYNNAGGGSSAADGPVTKVADEEFWRMIKLNLFSVWTSCRIGVPLLIANGGGSIINTTSIAGLRGLVGMDAYTASKGGIISLTRSLAVQFAPNKVRVNAVAPTSIQTERVMRARKDNNAAPNTKNLLGPGDPADVANTALYLASDDAKLITGQILGVDSGYLAH